MCTTPFSCACEHVHVPIYMCLCVLRICCMHAHIHVRACVCVCVCCTLQPKLAHMQACTDRVLVRSACGDTLYTHAETLYGKNEHRHSFQKKTTSERCATHRAVDRTLVHRGRGRASYIAMAKPSKTQLVTDYIQLEIGRPRMANRMWPCTICTVLARCEWCGCMDGGRRTVDKTGMWMHGRWKTDCGQDCGHDCGWWTVDG